MAFQLLRKRVRAVLAFTALLSVVAAFFVWRNYESRRQYLLDRYLCSAVKANDLPRVRDLLRQGADPNAREVPSSQPVGLVARFRLLLHGPPPDEPSWTVLHRAAYKGFDEAADLLLRSGAKVNALCKGSTPLNAATAYGRSRMVSRLLAAGADPSTGNPGGGITIMEQVVSSCNVAAVRDMIAHGARLEQPRILLRCAATNRDPAVMAFLLDRGLNPDFGKRTRWPLLYYAVAGGDVPVVRLLLQRGAKVNERDGNGWTPRHEAERRRASEPNGTKERATGEAILRLLKSYGAK